MHGNKGITKRDEGINEGMTIKQRGKEKDDRKETETTKRH